MAHLKALMSLSAMRLKQFFTAIFGDWLARMSGPATVLPTILAFHVTTPTYKIIYGAMAVGLVFVTSYRVWFSAIQQYEKELAKNSPQIGIFIHQLSVMYKLPTDPDGSRLLLTVSVRNTGAPSIVDGWSLTIEYPLGLEIQKMIAGNLAWHYSGHTLDYRFDDFIESKVADQPVVTGGKKVGLLLYRLKGHGIADLIANNKLPQCTLSGKDINGKEILATLKVTGQGPGLYYPGMREPIIHSDT